jgi:hypothetical protein
MFFFEKKNQKTFVSCGFGCGTEASYNVALLHRCDVQDITKGFSIKYPL